MSWSSGKDSLLALDTVRSSGPVDVVGLVTTVNSTHERVAMHGVRRAVLEAQAQVLGLPLIVVDLPWPCPNEVYESRMAAMIAIAKRAGVSQMVFGDLFLEDIRAYRERSLAPSGMEPLFPLWQRPTVLTARDILDAGIRAVVTCVDPAQAPADLAGRWYDQAFLSDLPAEVDPCGENGEFHTVVVDGPGFVRPLDIVIGETVVREGFVFTDVMLAEDAG
jgi:uncharacterized protein (TIGR00290 family)